MEEIQEIVPISHWEDWGRDRGYHCHNCGSGCLLNYESDFFASSYCPHCGAKMCEPMTDRQGNIL